MVFKNLLAVAFVVLLTGCGEIDLGKDVDFGIGEKLNPISTMVDANGVNTSDVILFDKTTRYIHKFSLSDMTHQRAWKVQNPSLDHYVLQASSGNYAIDISQKHISIFRADGSSTHNPIRMPGEPHSASFRSATGFVAIYDRTGAVGFLKLGANGEVIDSWVGGSIVDEDVMLEAGDFMEDGRLVLSLSDDSIAVVDATQTMAQKKWIFTKFAAPFADIKLISPIPSQPTLIMAFSSKNLALISLDTNSVVATLDLTIYSKTVAFSKRVNPHFIFEKPLGGRTLVYSKDGLIKQRDLPASLIANVSSTILDLAADQWTMVEKSRYKSGATNLLKYRFSDMLSTQTFALPANAQIEMSNSKVLALYPSELGYAVCYDVDTQAQKVAKLFNLGHIGE